jgi:hypothetical protein
MSPIIVYIKEQPSDKPVGTTQAEDLLKVFTKSWDCVWQYRDYPMRYLCMGIGVMYDGASAPPPVRPLIRPDGLIRAASAAHDGLYRTEGGRIRIEGIRLVNENGNRVYVSRKEADLLLRELMRYAGMSEFRCQVAYVSCRLLGKKYWGEDSPTIQKLTRHAVQRRNPYVDE